MIERTTVKRDRHLRRPIFDAIARANARTRTHGRSTMCEALP
jgi:hypothetical protein